MKDRNKSESLLNIAGRLAGNAEGFSIKSPLQNLVHARVPNHVPDEKKDRQQQQKMNQHAGYVEHQKAARP
jgi:hypothetical protein